MQQLQRRLKVPKCKTYSTTLTCQWRERGEGRGALSWRHILIHASGASTHTHRCLGEGRQVPPESGAHLTRRWRMRSGEHSVRPLGTGFIAVFGYSSKLKSKQAANKVKLQPARRRRNRSRSFSQFASLVCCVLPASFFYLLPARHFNLNLKFSGSTRLVAIRFDSIFRTCSR